MSQSFQADTSNHTQGQKKVRSFSVGQAVLVRNYRGGGEWLDGVITEVFGPITYMVSVNGTCIKRHVNQMLDTKRNDVPPEKKM